MTDVHAALAVGKAALGDVHVKACVTVLSDAGWSVDNAQEAVRTVLAASWLVAANMDYADPRVLVGDREKVAAVQPRTSVMHAFTSCAVLLHGTEGQADQELCPAPIAWQVNFLDYHDGLERDGRFIPTRTQTAVCQHHAQKFRTAPGFVSADPWTASTDTPIGQAA